MGAAQPACHWLPTVVEDALACTAYESVERLRTWASGRCLPADQPRICSANANAMAVKASRKVRRDPSNN